VIPQLNCATYSGNVVRPRLRPFDLRNGAVPFRRHGVTLTIFLSPYETIRGPMTLTNEMRSGDDSKCGVALDHPRERCSQKTIAPANDP
jgi:hypothetical protein